MLLIGDLSIKRLVTEVILLYFEVKTMPPRQRYFLSDIIGNTS
jgi:hypothetical protein